MGRFYNGSVGVIYSDACRMLLLSYEDLSMRTYRKMMVRNREREREIEWYRMGKIDDILGEDRVMSGE